jgi:hypothetical protein
MSTDLGKLIAEKLAEPAFAEFSKKLGTNINWPRPERCPRCNSPSAELHPAVQHEGEVQICLHEWHGERV